MNNIKRLKILTNNFLRKISEEKGEYGGKGKFELPKDHIAAIQVPKGGSCCQNCKYVNIEEHKCNNKYYRQWNGDDPKLPDLPLDEICSDWFEPKK